AGSCLRLLRELGHPALDFDRMEGLIKREVSLSLRILRFLNSAAFAWRSEIVSIKHALTLLGERVLRKWACTVALLAIGDDRPRALLGTCLERARFCELLGQHMGGNDFELFLVGLLSAADAIVRRPMAELVQSLACPPEVAAALCGAKNRLGQALGLALA